MRVLRDGHEVSQIVGKIERGPIKTEHSSAFGGLAGDTKVEETYYAVCDRDFAVTPGQYLLDAEESQIRIDPISVMTFESGDTEPKELIYRIRFYAYMPSVQKEKKEG
jgi:hypothetical protein